MWACLNGETSVNSYKINASFFFDVILSDSPYTKVTSPIHNGTHENFI